MMHILHLQHISIQTSHISSAQWPHVASGYCVGQHRSKVSKSGYKSPSFRAGREIQDVEDFIFLSC